MGQLYNTTWTELSSAAGEMFLNTLWKTVLKNVEHHPLLVSSSITLLLHKHGQKEPLQSAYCHHIDDLIDWKTVRRVYVAIGVTVLPPSGETSKSIVVGKDDGQIQEALMCRSIGFSVAGSKDFFNYECRHEEPILVNLAEDGSTPLRAHIVSAALYTEGIHVSRNRRCPTHHFDFHRYCSPDSDPLHDSDQTNCLPSFSSLMSISRDTLVNPGVSFNGEGHRSVKNLNLFCTGAPYAPLEEVSVLARSNVGLRLEYTFRVEPEEGFTFLVFCDRAASFTRKVMKEKIIRRGLAITVDSSALWGRQLELLRDCRHKMTLLFEKKMNTHTTFNMDNLIVFILLETMCHYSFSGSHTRWRNLICIQLTLVLFYRMVPCRQQARKN